MRARFSSRCPACHKTIHTGDDISQGAGGAWKHTQCPAPAHVPVGSITDLDPRLAIEWHAVPEVPEVPEELFTTVKGITTDSEGHIKKIDPSTSMDDLMAYDKRLRQETGSGVWDTPLMHNQFYDDNPFLQMIDDKVDRLETLYGKQTVIPMKSQSSTDREQRIADLRAEADNLERQEKARRKQQRKNAKAAKLQRRRTEVAMATLESIAADRKARKEDRVEAARVLLGRDY